MGKLTQRAVLAAKPSMGRDGKAVKRSYQDGDGLFLVCAPTGAKSWILRVQVDGKRRDIGLGSLDDGAGRNAFSTGTRHYGCTMSAPPAHASRCQRAALASALRA
ncbi:MAG: Arm DNA-binding domain-containing protein [Novosphingobium sp.]